MTRSGFTLLEVLLASALLGLVAGGALAWTTGGLRMLETARGVRGSSLWLDRTIRAIDRDLDEAASVEVEEAAGQIMLQTTHAAAGGAPGWREVRWSRDPEARAVIRAERLLDEDSWRTSTVLVDVDHWELTTIEGDAVQPRATLSLVLRTADGSRSLDREIE